MNARLLSAVALAAVAIAAAPVINWTLGSSAAVFAQSADAPAVSVPVAEVLVRRLAPTVRFTGHLEASHVVNITSRISHQTGGCCADRTGGRPLFTAGHPERSICSGDPGPAGPGSKCARCRSLGPGEDGGAVKGFSGRH